LLRKSLLKHQTLCLPSRKSLAEKKALYFKHQTLCLPSRKSLAEKKRCILNIKLCVCLRVSRLLRKSAQD
jgi:hypothetical protein